MRRSPAAAWAWAWTVAAVLLAVGPAAVSGATCAGVQLASKCATCATNCNRKGEMPHCLGCNNEDFNDQTNCLVCKDGYEIKKYFSDCTGKCVKKAGDVSTQNGLCRGVGANAPANGGVKKSNGNRGGSVATFSCGSGFTLQGASSVACPATGSDMPWPTSTAKCVQKDAGNNGGNSGNNGGNNNGGTCDPGTDNRVGGTASQMAGTATSKPMLISPLDGWALTDFAVSFRWQRLTGKSFTVSDYQLHVSTDANTWAGSALKLNVFHTASSCSTLYAYCDEWVVALTALASAHALRAHAWVRGTCGGTDERDAAATHVIERRVAGAKRGQQPQRRVRPRQGPGTVGR